MLNSVDLLLPADYLKKERKSNEKEMKTGKYGPYGGEKPKELAVV